MTSLDEENQIKVRNEDLPPSKSEKIANYARLVIAGCSFLTFVTILIVVLILVPRALSLMNTAQRTLDNLETVSEDLKALELAEAIKSIEDNTARAMEDVSGAMDQINSLDVDTLNQSIQELRESTEKFSGLLFR